jgi:hypothetical protein
VEQTRELEVFISSDQKEFQKSRQQLRDSICGIPYLQCSLMEDKGADPSSVLEASLKAVRDSDIYIGLFGRKYSEITIQEYQEAVKQRKPCFAYVKEARQRDERLEKFIKEVLERDFKYFKFGSKTKELTDQAKLDLQNFIFETLRMGIQARADRQNKTIELISQDNKNVEKYLAKEKPLLEAENLFKDEKYYESLFMTVAVVEATLRKTLTKKGVMINPSGSFGELITLAQEFKLYNNNTIETLRNLSICRNEIIHMAKVPNKKQVQRFLDSARLLVELQVSETQNNNQVAKLWKPFPKIKFNIGQWVRRICIFPQIAWEAYNDSPYQLKVWIEVHPILGGHDLHPLKEGDINGTIFYDAEPESYVFANGCFTLPAECATNKEELILEIRAVVEDVNDPSKGRYKLLPKRWKYIRETNSWSYYPQHTIP